MTHYFNTMVIYICSIDERLMQHYFNTMVIYICSIDERLMKRSREELDAGDGVMMESLEEMGFPLQAIGDAMQALQSNDMTSILDHLLDSTAPSSSSPSTAPTPPPPPASDITNGSEDSLSTCTPAAKESPSLQPSSKLL